MVLLRRTLLFVLLFSFCLTVCVLPVSAKKVDPIRGVNIFEPETFSVWNNANAASASYLFGSVPATFEFADGSYEWTWHTLSNLSSPYKLVTEAGKELTIMVILGDGNGDVEVSFTGMSLFPYISAGSEDFDFHMIGDAIFSVDDTVINEFYISNRPLGSFGAWSGKVNKYITLTYRFTDTCEYVTGKTGNYTINERMIVTLDNLVVDNVPDYMAEIQISVKDIETGVTEIISSVTNIEEGVVDIHDQLVDMGETLDNIDSTVTDTSNQLKDPDSSIWQAAGSAISGAIEDLFVPSQEDISNVKQGFDDLAEDKLGGAYTAMETVENTITEVNDKLNNPSAAEGVEFPGIAVPLGGDVGTVVLAERQMVTLPTRMTAILHPIAGTIISIICGLGTFNVLKDMVECFLSGFSYAAYLHRNKGGSDE